MTGGVISDLDEDGLPDIIWFVQGTLLLYRNSGPFQFERFGTFSEKRWLDGVSAAAAADLDRDGHSDLVLCRADLDLDAARAGTPLTETIEIWLGDGNGNFRDASREKGLGTLPSTDPEAVCTGLSLADLNGDGFLDLLPHFRSPFSSSPHPVQIFLSENGIWKDRGSELFPGVQTEYLWSVLWTAPNLWLLSAHHRTESTGSPWVFRRTSVRPLRFEPVPMPPNALRCPMGAAAANGQVFVTDNEDQHYFDEMLTDRAHELSTSLNPHLESRALGFTPSWLDVDLDGQLDLFVTMSIDQTYNDPPHAALVRGTGGRFEDATPLLRQMMPFHEQGASIADFDRDGRPDILTAADEGLPRLLRNEIPPRGHSLAVHLRGETSNPEGIGARITAGAETLDVSASGATYGESEQRLIFGVSEESATVEILWPTGKKQVLEHVTSTEIEVEEAP